MDSAYLSAIAELENGGDEIHGYSGEKLKDVVVIRDVDFAHERLWDWRDPQLLRLVRNGPARAGFRPAP